MASRRREFWLRSFNDGKTFGLYASDPDRFVNNVTGKCDLPAICFIPRGAAMELMKGHLGPRIGRSTRTPQKAVKISATLNMKEHAGRLVGQ